MNIPLPWPTPPLSANRVRGNPVARGRAVTAVRDTFRQTLRYARVQPVTPPVQVTLHYQLANRIRRDADGLAPTLKACLDAMVLEELLPDDSWAYVPRVTLEMHAPADGKAGALWLEVEAA